MKNIIKNGFYTATGLALIGLNSVSATITTVPVDDRIKGSNQTADIVIQDWVANLLSFLYLAAVLLGIWGGYNILTAAGDEEKVKKGKKIILQAMGGIVVIFLAGSLIDWLFTAIIGQ